MRKFNRRAARGFAAALAIGLSITTAGCGAVSNSSADTSAKGFKLAGYIQDRIDNGDPMRIKLSFGDPSISIAVPFRKGMEAAGKDLGDEVDFIGAAGGDTGKQVSQIQTLIQQKAIDGLGVQTASPDALKQVIDQAYAAGIPVITYNTDSPDSKEMGFVGQDLKTVAKSFGEELIKVLGPGAKGNVVAFSGEASAGWSQERQEGFEEALSGTDLKLVGPATTGFEPGQAYNTVESSLKGQSDIAAIVGLDCCGANYAAQWEQQSGKTGIVLAGFENLPDTAKNIKNGKIAFAVSQNPFQQAYQSIKLLHDFLIDGTPIKDITMPPLVVNKANVDTVEVEG